MSTAYPTLPIGPFEHIALDYEALRAEGLRLLGRLTGAQWTDHNVHDPGVTILEQLCYAITELAYRASYPIPDLLAGSDLAAALPGPTAVLTCDPVTEADLRKLVLDEQGVRNVVVAPHGEPELPVYHHAGTGELRFLPELGDVRARPLQIAGLTRVAVQCDAASAPAAVLERALARVHAHRGLATDVTVEQLTSQEVFVAAKIEVGPIDDPTALLVELLARIEAHLAPTVRFTALADAGEAPWDALLAGPALRRGVVVGDPPVARRSVRASDILHVITDHPAVRAVRSLALATDPDPDVCPREQWLLELRDDRVAALDWTSELTLMRGGLPLRVDRTRIPALRDQRRAAAADLGPAEVPRPAPGRPRDLGRYRSIQAQFPAIYGLGPSAPPASAGAARLAQARQLSAYLLIFDQLLANACAQLDRVRDLLAPDAGDGPTYHSQPVSEMQLGELVRKAPDALGPWLSTLVERADQDPPGRRKRFLAHLLARFAEHVGDGAQIGGADDDVIADRQAFLRQIPRLGGARGTGRDVLGGAAASSLELRIRLKLGLGEQRFHLVEHVLLRPIPADIGQRDDDGFEQVPLLAPGSEPDPWSLQISFVFAGKPGAVFEDMVVAAVLAETPVHLRPRVLWFDAEGRETWDAFAAAWLEFQSVLRDYRLASNREALHLRYRDARDRVIDLIGLGLPPGAASDGAGRTYPLRDVPVCAVVRGEQDLRAAIPIDYSQPLVSYHLFHDSSDTQILDDKKKAIRAVGTGGAIKLLTPALRESTSYRIKAFKHDDSGPQGVRWAWLKTSVRVEMGIDLDIVAQLRLPPLEPAAKPAPDAARIADHGAVVEVEILASQNGVTYDLVADAEPARVLSQAPVLGNTKTVVLKLGPVTDDIDLRVRGYRQGRSDSADLLAAVLPLRVRADRTIAADVWPAPIVEHGARAPRSLLPPGLAPTGPNLEPRPYEFSVKLRFDVAGKVSAIRFHKPTPGGEHSVSLWRPDGTLITSAAAPNAAPGWNEVPLVPPVAVVPGEIYVASYFTQSGYYVEKDRLATAGIDRAPVHLLGTSEGGGCWVSYAHVFPTNARTYYPWIDVAFVPEVAPPVLRLASSQTDAEYRVHRRRVRDSEFVRDEPQGPTLAVADGERNIRVALPGAPTDWDALTAIDKAVPGTGGPLDLPLGQFVEDSYLFVQVVKRHRKAPRSRTVITSTTDLIQVRTMFVRPDRDVPLVIDVWPVAATTGDAVQLGGGQPGVYYALNAAGAPISGPGYFHQRDDDDPEVNKGVSQLVIGTDFAIPRDREDPDPRDRTKPLDPRLDATRRPLAALARVSATRAFSGITAELARQARIDAPPKISAEAPTVAVRGATRILVDKSVVGERYGLVRDGVVIATVVGTGETVALATGPLAATTTFDVTCQRADPAGLVVVRHVAITVTVQ
jgi:hypothetical protein